MKKKINWLVLPIGVFLLNVLLKLFYLGVNTVDVDEPFSIYIAQGSLSAILKLTDQEITPPLFYIILHYWIKFFGISPLSVRFLPMLFGALTSVFTYLIGNRFYNVVVGMSAALLFTFSNIVIMESHDARAYTLLLVLCTASMYYYLALNDSPASKKNLTCLTIINILLLFSNLFGIFIIGLQIFYTLIIPGVRSRVLRVHWMSVLLQALFYLPYFFIFSVTLLLRRASEPGYYESSNLSNLHLSAWAFSNYDMSFLIFASLIIAFGLITIVLRKSVVTNNDIIIFGWFVLLYIGLFLISYKVPITNPKYFMFMVPAFYLMIAISANRLHKGTLDSWFVIKRDKRFWIGVILTLACIYKLGKTVDLKISNYAGIADVVDVVEKKRSESTTIYLTPVWLSLSFSYHHNKNIFTEGNIINALQKENIYSFDSKSQMPAIVPDEKSDAILVVGNYNASSTIADTEEIYRTLSQYYSHVSTLYTSQGYTVYNFYH